MVGTRVDPKTAERLEKVAKADFRTVGNVVELLISRALPDLEAEVMGEPQEVEA